MGAEPSRPGDYLEPDLPRGEFEVRLSVYTFDFSGISLFNNLGSGITGAYHSGLVVLGNEYSFGAHDDHAETGIYVCKPEMNPDYQFYDRVVMGRLRGSQQQILSIIRNHMEMEEWHGKRYDLLENNCNHFASDLCWALLRRRPPDWINNTADRMARNHRTTHTLQQAIRLAVASYRGRFGGGVAPQGGEVVGENAFKTTFEYTCTNALEYNADKFQLPKEHVDIEAVSTGDSPSQIEVVDLNRLPENRKDIVALRKENEQNVHNAIILAAKSAAHAVAYAARKAGVARAKIPESRHEAWDRAWAEASAPLLKQWREEAVVGKLLVDFSDAAATDAPAVIQQRVRDRQIQAALAAAERAALGNSDDELEVDEFAAS